MTEEYRTRQTLLEKILDRHDEQSWEEFVFFYQRYIYSIIRKCGLQSDDSNDLAQEVLLKLWKTLPELKYDRNKGGFRVWLYSVTRNTVNTFLAKAYRQKEKYSDLKDNYPILISPDASEPEVRGIIENEWELHITNLAFDNISKSISPKAVEVFKLLLQGLSAAEIVERSGVAESTVYVYKKRVEKKLIAEISALRDLLE